MDPEQNFITGPVGPFICSFLKNTFNDPNVKRPFTERKQSAAHVWIRQNLLKLKKQEIPRFSHATSSCKERLNESY